VNTASRPDIRPVIHAWNLDRRAWFAERLGGSNNESWRIETPDRAYVLRLYRNSGNLPHVAFEHVLLRRLALMSLSFEVPLPLMSREGRALERLKLYDVPVPVSLFGVIPGEHPAHWNDEGRARAAGAALGELDAALARVEMPPGMESLPTYADLDRIHPAVHDPESDLVALPIERSLLDAFGTYLARTRETLPRLYGPLPQQIIHSDLGGSNLLLVGDRVSGVLDFEFASLDLRAMDLAVAIGLMGPVPDHYALDLNVVRTLAAGYGEWIQLTPEEIAVVPDLLRLRGAVTTVHRLGRWKEGLSFSHAVETRIRANLALMEWVDAHRGALIDALSGAA
jgi:homoserine kinase type II